MKNNNLPNFIILGAGKSGTTSLYHYLKQHPQVYMSPIKEPNFFALEGQKKITGYDNEDPHGFNFYPWAVTDMKNYEKLFSEVKNEIAIGESSTMYQYMPNVPEKIKSTIPNVKLIGIFRNPADRLWSRYLHLARESREPTEHFEDCLDRSSLWWKKNDLIQEGFYYTHMKRYFELFPKNQIKIFLYEELRQNPKKLVREMFEFLEVDSNFVPDLSTEFNVSGKIKNKFVDKFIGQNSFIRKSLEKISPKTVNLMRNNSGLQKFINNLRNKNLVRPDFNPNVRGELLHNVYRDEILQFQTLINRDLSKWLK